MEAKGNYNLGFRGDSYFTKALDVVKKCETMPQLETAVKYVNNYFMMTESIPGYECLVVAIANKKRILTQN